MSEMSAAERLARMGVNPDVSAAYDLLTDDGMDPDHAAYMALVAERDGRDPEAFARQVIKLRKALRT